MKSIIENCVGVRCTIQIAGVEVTLLPRDANRWACEPHGATVTAFLDPVEGWFVSAACKSCDKDGSLQPVLDAIEAAKSNGGFREKLLIVRGANGMEFSVPYDEIDESSEVQGVRDSGTLITKRSFAEQAGLAPPPEPTPAEETTEEEETTMAFEQRDLSGSLFRNDKKSSDKHPDLKGSVIVRGEEFWLAGIKTGQNGKKFYSLALTAKSDQRQGTSAQRHDDDLDDALK